VPEVDLVPYTEADEWLTVALETDPRVMAELGGPWTVDQARATHARRVSGARANGNWCLRIVRLPDRETVGSMMLWDSEWAGEAMSEAGWMVLPDHQGQGYASAALRLLLDRAAAAGDRWGDVHAFPGASNAPSNALCRKLGFEQLEEGVADYADRHFPVIHWVHRAAK